MASSEVSKVRNTILITGGAGNLGTRLARHLLSAGNPLRLMQHQSPVDRELATAPSVSVVSADLASPQTLGPAFRGVDHVVHLAGKLFAPQPEQFLPTTNVTYVENAVEAALRAQVDRFILVSFPHVEGESDPQRPASGALDGSPGSVHARTRLQAEKRLFDACEAGAMTPIVLRAGLIYANGTRLIEGARWLMARRLLGVWRQPTWMHLLSLPDFLRAVTEALGRPEVSGIYNLGDEAPLTLQAFLDALADHWGHPRPWRAPLGLIKTAASLTELFAQILGTAAPLTRDFIRIGTASYVMDTSRSRQELLPHLEYPTLADGWELLT